MSHYSYLRGWIEFAHESEVQIKRKIESAVKDASDYGLTPEKADLYLSGWNFQSEPSGAMGYVFYGQEIRTDDVKFIEDLIQELSENVKTIDGEFTDYSRGVFHLDTEDEQETSVWIIRNGLLQKQTEAFLFD